jgi:hypothetical protein
MSTAKAKSAAKAINRGEAEPDGTPPHPPPSRGGASPPPGGAESQEEEFDFSDPKQREAAAHKFLKERQVLRGD